MNTGILGFGDNSQARLLSPRSALYTFLPTDTNAPGARYNFGNHNVGPFLTTLGNVGLWNWAVPDWVQFIHALLVGGGGGGASGQTGAANATRNGGGGGGAAGSGFYWIPMTLVPSRRIFLTVGAGGAGANGVSTNNANGGLGTSGGVTIMGTDKFLWPVTGGRTQGAYNTGALASNGSGVGYATTQYIGTAAANGGAGAVGADTTGSTVSGPCRGGGGGGGISSANAVFNGGAGGIASMYLAGTAHATSWAVNAYTTLVGGTAGGAGDSAFSKHGLVGNYLNEFPLIGASGGGGASSVTATAGAGGSGAYGGGGGGGGAALNGFTSGAGGNGGPGIALLFCFG